MRIARFTTGDGAAFGVVEGDGSDPAADGAGLTVRRIEGHPFAPFQVVGDPLPLSDVRLLAPVLPSKVVAVLLTRRRSYWVLAVPVVGAVLWWGVVSAGEKWLDWSG